MGTGIGDGDTRGLGGRNPCHRGPELADEQKILPAKENTIRVVAVSSG